MAEYQGYVAPVGQATSYSEALQKRMDRIQEQQRQNVDLLMKVQQDKNELRAKQLERLYGFKTNGWGDMPVQMFNEQRQRVTDKLKSNAYTTLEDFYTDLNGLNTTHSFFTNHYDVTNPVMQETMKYAVNPGLYSDKTKRVLDDQQSAAQKFQLQRDLGIQGYIIGDNGEITIEIDDPTESTGKKQVSLFDNPYAGNVVAYSPTVDWNYLSPEVLTDDYRALVIDQLNYGKNGNEVFADFLPQVTSKVMNDPAFLASAEILWKQQHNGSSEVNEKEGSAVEQYAKYYAEASLAPYKTLKKQWAPRSVSTGRASGTTKPEPILSVSGSKVEIEVPQMPTEMFLSGMLNTKPETKSGYRYALPNIKDEVNVANLVPKDVRDQLDGKVTVIPRTIVFLEDSMIIQNATTSDDTDIGDISVPYKSAEGEIIAAIIREVYGPQYSIGRWQNGEIARALGGAPQVQATFNANPGGTKFNAMPKR